MATNSPEILTTLRITAQHLETSTDYQWGHMGACNCGFLAREVTKLTKAEIHTNALEKPGDWSEQLRDYCPSSGLPMDGIIDSLVAFGFKIDQLRHLERLSDPEILASMNHPVLRHNVKSDVVKYLRAWANLVESSWLETISIEINAPELVPVP